MKQLASAVLVPIVGAWAASGFAATTLSEAIKDGEAQLSLRLRYEDVEVDFDNPALQDDNDALILRTRLNYKTADFYNFSAFIEVDDITAADDDYNDTVNGEPGPPIADPEGTEVNQAWLNYHRWQSDFRWGRQRITLDNHRFIGNVGWRQNEQTYDAFSASSKALADTRLFYAYTTNVNRIFGEDSPVGDANIDSHLFNASYSGLPVGQLTGYAYLLESDDRFPGFADWSTDTFGVRFSGKIEGDISYHYTLEYARQSEADDNPKNYDADYLHLEGGVGVAGVKVTLGHETLGADGDDGFFVTPLATLHKFQGWADVFLNSGKGNIAEGIQDTYLSAATTLAGIKLLAVYHDYTSDEDNAAGDDDLGDEFGFAVSRQFGAYGLQLKFTDYSAGDSSLFNGGGLRLRDTQKLWLTATADF